MNSLLDDDPAHETRELAKRGLVQGPWGLRAAEPGEVDRINAMLDATTPKPASEPYAVQRWLGTALGAIPEPLMLLANFVGPKVRLPKAKAAKAMPKGEWNVEVLSDNPYTGQRHVVVRDENGKVTYQRSGFRGTDEDAIAYAQDLHGVRVLDMSPAAVAARSKEHGYREEPFFHGTTHNIKSFADPLVSDKYVKDAYHGPAVYASTSRSDASGNYATAAGPDIKARIMAKAEELGFNSSPDELDPQSLRAFKKRLRPIVKLGEERGDVFGPRASEWDKLMWAKAYEDIVGPMPEGNLLELRVAPKNPVIVAPDNLQPQTRWYPGEAPYRIETPEPGVYEVTGPRGKVERFVQDEASAYDLMDDLNRRHAADNPGPADKIPQMVRDMGTDRYISKSADRLADEIAMHIMENESISAGTLEKMYRGSDLSSALMAQHGDTGAATVASGLQSIYRALGHDAAILKNAEKTFRGMNIPPNTDHIAMFTNRGIRSVDAKFDPLRRNDTDILASLAAAGLLTGAGSAAVNGMLQD